MAKQFRITRTSRLWYESCFLLVFHRLIIDFQKATDTIIRLDIDNNGLLFPKSQVVDYQLRGELLSNISVFDFFTHTYDFRSTMTSQSSEDRPSSDSPSSSRGRPQNRRIFYLPSHPRAKKSCRVVRSDNHRHITNFIGSWFPSNADNTSLYCAAMLMLLKPWRCLDTDLKSPTESWQSAFTRFIRDNPSLKSLLSNIQYYHDARIIASDTTNAYPTGESVLDICDGVLSEPFVDDIASLANAIPVDDYSISKTSSDNSSWREDFFAHCCEVSCFSLLSGTETVPSGRVVHLRSWVRLDSLSQRTLSL